MFSILAFFSLASHERRRCFCFYLLHGPLHRARRGLLLCMFTPSSFFLFIIFFASASLSLLPQPVSTLPFSQGKFERARGKRAGDGGFACITFSFFLFLSINFFIDEHKKRRIHSFTLRDEILHGREGKDRKGNQRGE